MTNKYTYVSAEVILNKLSRDLRGTDIHESDVIDWTGEALGAMKVANILEEAVAFVDVKNHHTAVPLGMQYVMQIARDYSEGVVLETEEVSESVKVGIAYSYMDWVQDANFKTNFAPVRLSSHKFFSSVVCKEDESIYDNACRGDEYSLAINRFRFSFSEGSVAIAYLRTAVCEMTGYPMIPDSYEHISAITYYIKWKMAERFDYAGREGWGPKSEKAEKHWLKYVKMANNAAKMPQTLDEWQDLMDQGNYLLPRRKRYDGYFGNLAQPEQRRFNNPDNRLRRN